MGNILQYPYIVIPHIGPALEGACEPVRPSHSIINQAKLEASVRVKVFRKKIAQKSLITSINLQYLHEAPVPYSN